MSCSPRSLPSRLDEDLMHSREVPPDLVTGNFGLLALFDGIRGCSTALRSLGVEPAADYSSELEENCQRLIAHRFPSCVQLGDVRKIGEELLAGLVSQQGLWLVVGGSPCQDLSGRRGAKARGLAGRKSKLFFEFVRIVNALLSRGAKVVFLLENVASMPDSERDAISASLGVDPVELDSAAVSACHRQRYYWTNLFVAPLYPRAVDIDALLDAGWRRVPAGKPFRCFVASAAFQTSRGRGELGGVCSNVDGSERPPNADERERILGFPPGHTQLEGFSEGLRLKLMGNSFSVQVVAHLLSPFAEHVRWGTPLKLQPLRQDAWVVTMNRMWEGEDEEEPHFEL